MTFLKFPLIFAFVTYASQICLSRTYSRCELAKILHDSNLKPSEIELANWLCILFWESGYNSKAFRTGNFDGSANYGLFQINDLMWCKSNRMRNNTNFCDQSCESKCLIREYYLDNVINQII